MKREKLRNNGLSDPNSLADDLLEGASTLLQMSHHGDCDEVKIKASSALTAWHDLFSQVSNEPTYKPLSEATEEGRLETLRNDILKVTLQPDIPQYLAGSMELLLEHIDELLIAHKSGRIKRMFPALEADSTKPKDLLISEMVHYRLCATCLDCDEDIFKDLRVPQIVKLTGRDAPWSEFKVKCQKDRTHTVHMVARYDPRDEQILPSYYRGAPLDPIGD